MPVISIKEKAKGREAGRSENTNTYSRVFLVETDAVSDGPQVAREASGIPRMFDVHPADNRAFVNDISVRETENRKLFEVFVSYQTFPGRHFQRRENPLREDPEIDWSFVNESEIVTQDTAGKAITNSAGDVFDPPLEQTRSFLQFGMVRNERDFDPAEAVSFINSVNSVETTIGGFIAAARTAKMVEMSGKSVATPGRDYWVVSYKVIFDEDTFDREVLDAGFNALNAAGKKVKIHNEGDGTDATQPVKLDGAGKVLAAAAPGVLEVQDLQRNRFQCDGFRLMVTSVVINFFKFDFLHTFRTL